MGLFSEAEQKRRFEIRVSDCGCASVCLVNGFFVPRHTSAALSSRYGNIDVAVVSDDDDVGGGDDGGHDVGDVDLDRDERMFARHGRCASTRSGRHILLFAAEFRTKRSTISRRRHSAVRFPGNGPHLFEFVGSRIPLRIVLAERNGTHLAATAENSNEN
ncbi:unnamed protein product [Heligmosomoides polygyrus]|uniref:Uncharacterized protein n=1 Tax=Heligmosomoides polygyrus TaxID=6339 RepID=A0A183FHJ1_HELPZ|nr:unnamed protein product [Heligmosomoides polygyrus]